MKKLAYLASAVAAAFAGTAHADVAVSGSGSASYVSNASNDGLIITAANVGFALSTTAANGMGISTAMGINLTDESDVTVGSVSGGNSMTFTTGGATIVVGDIELGDTPGSVGGVAGGLLTGNDGLASNAQSGFTDDDGTGVSFSTAVGGSTVSFGHIFNDDGDNRGNMDASGAQTMTAASITMPMGAFSLTAGIADHDSGESASGASISYAIGGGTLVAGYSQQTLVAASSTSDKLSANGDTTVLGATYTMALDADTSVAVGYQSTKDGDSDSSSLTDLSISRALGGGASVYLDVRSETGDMATDGTAMGFGTTVSF